MISGYTDYLDGWLADNTAGDIAQPIGWAFAWWGTGLYWWSGIIYLRQVAAVRGRRAARLVRATGEQGRAA
jgi:hypothetical protein